MAIANNSGKKLVGFDDIGGEGVSVELNEQLKSYFTEFFKKTKPTNWHLVQRRKAARMFAHHSGNPYPRFGFGGMRLDVEGHLPVSMPIPNIVSNQITSNLFGTPPELCIDSKFPEISELIHVVWDTVIVPELQTWRDIGAIFGSVLLKIDISEMNELKITPLDCRNYYVIANPINKNDITAIAIRYPVKMEDGWYWYAEAYTSEYHVTFEPQLITEGFRYAIEEQPFEMSKTWESAYVEGLSNAVVSNVFYHGYGFIPLVMLNNKVSPISIGPMGDLFNLDHIIRRIDLVYHLKDISNQSEAQPIKVYQNCIDADEISSVITPGASVYVNSAVTEDGDILPANVTLLEAKGSMRTHFDTYTHDVKALLYEAAGVVITRADEITNKGNMTPSVMGQMHAPANQAISRYRQLYGKGLIELLQKITLAYARRFNVQKLFDAKFGTDPAYNGLRGGGSNGLNGDVGGGGKLPNLPQSMYELRNVFSLKWNSSTSFMGEQEKLYAVERVIRSLDLGLISLENAIRIISALEGVDKDIDQWIEKMVADAEEKKVKADEATKEKRESKELPRVEQK